MSTPLKIPGAHPSDHPPLDVEAPFDGTPIGEIDIADATAVETALVTAERLFRDLDQAISRANALPFAFQPSIFTGDLEAAMRATDRLKASAVMVNDHAAFRVDWMPFAGLKQSGLGVGGIPHTIRDMRVENMIIIRSKQL